LYTNHRLSGGAEYLSPFAVCTQGAVPLVQALEERGTPLTGNLLVQKRLDLGLVKKIQVLVQYAPVLHGRIVNELFKALQVKRL